MAYGLSKLYLASVSAIVHLIVSQADHQTIPILHRRDLFIYFYIFIVVNNHMRRSQHFKWLTCMDMSTFGEILTYHIYVVNISNILM